MKGVVLVMIRGIRGATTVSKDLAREVLQATQELLTVMQKENQFDIEDIAAVFFTVTSDVRSVFPAKAARSMGWNQVALLCSNEIEVDGALPRCIRVLILINTNKRQAELKHIYLRESRGLRKDLTE
jgi:chorismate mutase